MIDIINDFEEQLKEALRWEKLMEPEIRRKIFLPKIELIDFNKLPDIQRRGIDYIIHKEEPKLDLKIREYYFYKFKDILIETISVVETNKKGWFYTSDADCILYCWKNDAGNNLIDGYILLFNDMSDWFENNKYLYKSPKDAISRRGNLIWHTRNRPIPISVLLNKGYIVHFNPKLNRSEQLTLSQTP